MPTYIYKCERCGHVFEVTHGLADLEMPRACPECGMWRTHRIPQKPLVNWNGPRPSRGGIHPELKELADERNVDARRAANAEKYGS